MGNKVEQVKNGDPITWRSGLEVFSEISSWIIGPIIFALIIGKWVDSHYGSAPWGFIGFTFFGFLITIYGIVRAVKKYTKKISE